MSTSHPAMGVEEEFLLVDSASGEPLPRSVAVAGATQEVDVHLELTKPQVEINAPACKDSAELWAQLSRMRSALATAAARDNARVLAVGVPPKGAVRQIVTDKPRYQKMAARYGQLAREQAVCGCHVHVDVPDRQTAVQVSNHLRPWLPVLLALTANSPVYLGNDTGFASWRTIVWSRWPCSGPPPLFRSAEHYDALVAMQIGSGILLDEQMVYWDIRPSSHLETVEVRVSDVPATVDETVLLAVLIRGLVMTALAAISRGDPAPAVEPEILRAATWLAARDGLSGHGLDVVQARPVPVPELLDLLVGHVGPALDEVGERKFAEETLQKVLREGNGAIRQRRALQRGDDVTDVVAVTETG